MDPSDITRSPTTITVGLPPARPAWATDRIADWCETRVPSCVRAAGPEACRRFVEFFAATIRNPNTRVAYARATGRFLTWAESCGLNSLREIDPVLVAGYIERLGTTHSRPTCKQHLAAIGRLFAWLVTGGVLASNPAASVRGPSHVVRRGSTPVLTAEEARQLLDSIATGDLAGLRDRALIATMLFTFARVSAALGMAVGDYYPEGKRWWLRLREKGGKVHQLPVHHTAEEYLDEYLDAAGIRDQPHAPLFQSINAAGLLTGRPLGRGHALRMIKRRARRADLATSTCCHTFRATGITAYLSNGGTLERAQAIAAHESPRTTKLYDRTSDAITLDEIERIQI